MTGSSRRAPRQELLRQAAWPAVAMAHLGGAIAAVARATAFGRSWPDIVSCGFAALAVLVAALVVCLWLVTWGRRARWRIVAGSFALALLLPQIWVQREFGRALFRTEDAVGTGLIPSDDGAYFVSLSVHEYDKPHQTAYVGLLRRADGAQWSLALPSDRTELDCPFGGVDDPVRLSSLGRGRYWLVVSTALSRVGPQHFLIDTTVDPPDLTEQRRGLTRADGRAAWDCSVWDADRQTAAVDPCATDGELPPRRICSLAALARACDDALAPAAGCHPQWAVDASGVRACLTRRAEALGDPLAIDALVLISVEERDVTQALRWADVAARVPAGVAGTCGALRAAALRAVAARRLRYPGLQRAAQLELDRLDSGAAARQRCAALPAVAEELQQSRAARLWDIVQIDRWYGEVTASCARLETLARTGGAAALPPAAGEDFARWAAACRAAAAAEAKPRGP